MLLLVLHVIVLVVLIVVNMLACVPTTLQPLMSTKLVEFCYKSEIWATFRWYVMVKWDDWGYRSNNPYSSYINVIYIYKVFDNLYMLWMCIWMCPHHLTAAHADQACGILLQIWASLSWYVMVKWGDWGCWHIYKRCLTTFICCGCGYGCVPTTLRPLMPTKLVEFCYKFGQVPADVMVK